MLDGVPLNRIADAVGTPTWVYSAGTLRSRYRALAAALKDAGLDAQPHYAVKAPLRPGFRHPISFIPGSASPIANCASR